MFVKPLMNRGVVSAVAERMMTLDPLPLTDEELEQLAKLLSDPTNRAAHDLLAFTGARTAAGLIAHVMAAESADRAILITAIRRALNPE